MKHEVDEVEIGTQFCDSIVRDIKFFIVVTGKENAISLSMLISDELAEVNNKGLPGSLVVPLLSENAGMLSCYSLGSNASTVGDSLIAGLINRSVGQSAEVFAAVRVIVG